MATAARRLPTQLLFGLLVVLVGVLLLLDTTGIVDTSPLWRFVPLLFVFVGLYAILASGFRNLFGPLVVIVLAGLWQLATLDLINGLDLVSLWPLLIVLFGLSLLANHFRPRPASTPDSHVSSLAILGGSEKRVTGPDFTGADLTAAFGAVSLDLRDATIATPPAHVTVVALFGGGEVIVPREWNVEIDVLPVLGGVSDERARAGESHEQVDLVVTGFVAFGGIEVTD